MSATLTCKCPGCDRITSQCKDSTLTEDRTEYDGKRCKVCTRKKPGRGIHEPAQTRYATKKTMAQVTPPMHGHY